MIAVFVFFFLLVIGTPIALVVLFTSLVGTLTYTTTAPNVVIAQMFAGMDTTTLLAVPFFIVAGMIASKGKTSEKLVQVMNLIFGRLPGGPVIATIFTCAFFAAISGSSMATVIAVGSIMLPQLKKLGYPEAMNIGVITAGGSIGILIPPSAPMVMFCVALSSSVGKQFMAGFVPGILLAIAWAIYTLVVCIRHNYHFEAPKVAFKEGVMVVIKALPALFFPVIVLGSIYAGWATPTESAAISLVYVTIIEMFLYRTVKVREYVEMFLYRSAEFRLPAGHHCRRHCPELAGFPDADSRAGNELHFRLRDFPVGLPAPDDGYSHNCRLLCGCHCTGCHYGTCGIAAAVRVWRESHPFRHCRRHGLSGRLSEPSLRHQPVR